jgi:uncharacterized protein DUF4157
MTSGRAADHRLETRVSATSSERQGAVIRQRSYITDLQRAVGNQVVDALLEGRGPATASETLDSRSPTFDATGGQPLHPSVRASMEARFGRDLDRVRIHAGRRAAESAEAMGADAYTVGTHIVFDHDRYAPETAEGKWLLAHELSHVIQQSRGGGDPATRDTESAADLAADAVAAGSHGTVAVDGASGVGIARKQKEPQQASISHFDDDLTTVVFDQPVSVDEANRILFRSPPRSRSIAPDSQEQAHEGRQRRFRVDVKFEIAHNLQVTDSFKRAAQEALPRVDPAEQLQKRGLPAEVARAAPTLPYERAEITEKVDVSQFHALQAQWEHFWERPGVAEWELSPGAKEITRTEDRLYRFPGVVSVRGKTFVADWLVRTRSGTVEAWQLRPTLAAYIEAADGDVDLGRRHWEAALTTQGYILGYWQEGHSLDDAMGLERSEVEADVKSRFWSAAGLVQSAAGLSSVRAGLGREIVEGFPIKSGPQQAARSRADPSVSPSSTRSRSGGPRESGTGLAGPRRNTGAKPPPGANAKRLQATGTDARASVPDLAIERPGASVGLSRSGAGPVAVKGPGVPGGVKKQVAPAALPDPRKFDVEAPSRVAPEPHIHGAGKPPVPNEAPTGESTAKNTGKATPGTEKAVSELEPKKILEAGKRDTRSGVKQHSEQEWSSLAGYAMEPHVVKAWATPLEEAGFTVYRTDQPAGPNLETPASAAEGAPGRKEFVPSWYESQYRPFPRRFSELFAGEGPDAIAESGDTIVVFDVAPTYSLSHFAGKAELAQRVADAFPQSRVYIQEGYWGEPTPGGGYILLSPRLVRPSRGAPPIQ